jgi:hypothetical protein
MGTNYHLGDTVQHRNGKKPGTGTIIDINRSKEYDVLWEYDKKYSLPHYKIWYSADKIISTDSWKNKIKIIQDKPKFVIGDVVYIRTSIFDNWGSGPIKGIEWDTNGQVFYLIDYSNENNTSYYYWYHEDELTLKINQQEKKMEEKTEIVVETDYQENKKFPNPHCPACKEGIIITRVLDRYVSLVDTRKYFVESNKCNKCDFYYERMIGGIT